MTMRMIGRMMTIGMTVMMITNGAVGQSIGDDCLEQQEAAVVDGCFDQIGGKNNFLSRQEKTRLDGMG